MDTIIQKVAKKLGVEIPAYSPDMDPTKEKPTPSLEWTIPTDEVKALDKIYARTVKELAKTKKKTASSARDEKQEFKFKAKKLKKDTSCEGSGEGEIKVENELND